MVIGASQSSTNTSTETNQSVSNTPPDSDNDCDTDSEAYDTHMYADNSEWRAASDLIIQYKDFDSEADDIMGNNNPQSDNE